jgi:hypothetical protein
MPLNLRASKKQRTFDLPVSYKINETRERLKDAMNVFSNQGRLETRYGRSLYNSTLLSGSVTSISFFKHSNGTRYLIAKVGTTLVSVNTSGAATTIKTGLTAGVKHRGITWARGSTSRHIISCGADGLFQWDGTTFTILGEDPPVGHTIATTTGTLTNGTYRVHLTFYSSTTGFETNSSYSSPVTTVAQGIAVSAIPTTSANATINKVNVYLENMGSNDDPLYCGQVSLGTSTYTISGNPTSSATRPLTNAKPLSGGGKFITEFNRQLVYSGNGTFKNDVYFSEQDVPDAFNDGTGPNRLVVYASGNGEVTGLATGLFNNTVLNPYLVIFKKRSTEIYSEINGEGNSVVISREIGCVSHETIQVKNGNVYFLSDQGWREIENGRITLAQTGNPATLGLGDVDDIFRQPGFEYEVNRAQMENAFSVYYSTYDQYLTWIAEGASTEFTKTYSYEFKVGGFKPYSFHTPSTCACIGENADGIEVVFMADANGAIYTHSAREDRADHDSTGADQIINAFAIATWTDGDDMDASYNFREMILRRVVGTGTMSVKAWVNYGSGEAGSSYDFQNPATGFVLDVSSLDVDEFGTSERSIITSRQDLNVCGENILIGFYQYALNSNIGLVSYQLDFSKNGNRN